MSRSASVSGYLDRGFVRGCLVVRVSRSASVTECECLRVRVSRSASVWECKCLGVRVAECEFEGTRAEGARAEGARAEGVCICVFV